MKDGGYEEKKTFVIREGKVKNRMTPLFLMMAKTMMMEKATTFKIEIYFRNSEKKKQLSRNIWSFDEKEKVLGWINNCNRRLCVQENC